MTCLFGGSGAQPSLVMPGPRGSLSAFLGRQFIASFISWSDVTPLCAIQVIHRVPWSDQLPDGARKEEALGAGDRIWGLMHTREELQLSMGR